MTNIHKSILLVVGIAAIAALAVSLIFYPRSISQNQENEIIADISDFTPSEVAEWKTYRNEEYEFEVRYPPNWELIKDQKDSQIPYITFKSKNGAGMIILPKGEFDRGLGSIVSRENIDIDGHPAIKTNYGIRPDGKQHLIISILNWFPHNRIEFLSSKENINIELEQLDQILSTFKFIEPQEQVYGGKFSFGDRVMTIDFVRSRKQPSLSSPSVKVIDPYFVGEISVENPVFADGFWWWKVIYNDGISGWSAENYLAPAPSIQIDSLAGVKISPGDEIMIKYNSYLSEYQGESWLALVLMNNSEPLMTIPYNWTVPLTFYGDYELEARLYKSPIPQECLGKELCPIEKLEYLRSQLLAYDRTNLFIKPSVDLLPLDGGNRFVKGTSYSIRWRYSKDLKGRTVMMNIGRSGSPSLTIVSSYPIEKGLYEWTVPTSIMSSDDYFIYLEVENEKGGPIISSSIPIIVEDSF